MGEIHKSIGSNIAKVRKTRGLSLDQVAQLTGVSKGMLARIEKGTSNPTISIIWKIVNGLQLSFTSLLQNDPTDVSFVSYKTINPLTEQQGLFRSYPLFPYDSRTRLEMYLVEMEPGCVHPSDAHNSGVEEYLFVIEGTMLLSVLDKRYTLEAGQAIRFTASAPHSYCNETSSLARFHATISYSN